MAGSTGYIRFMYEVTGASTPPGNEATTVASSTKTLYPPFISFNSTFNPTILERDDELRGINEALSVLPDKFDPTLTLVTPMYPDSLAFFLKAICGAPTTTVGDGAITDPDGATIPASTWRHVFTAPGSTATAQFPVTMRVSATYKDTPTTIVSYEARGCAVTNISFSMAQSRIMMTIQMTPTYYARVADPGLTPAYESLPNVHPFREKDVTIPTWLASTSVNESGGLDFQIDQPVQTHRTMAAASLYPDLIDRGDGLITISGNINKRHLGAIDWDAFIANTGFATKIKFANDSVIASARTYGFWVETTNTQYISGDPVDLTNTRNIGATYGWRATNASGTAGSWTLTCINGTSSYA